MIDVKLKRTSTNMILIEVEGSTAVFDPKTDDAETAKRVWIEFCRKLGVPTHGIIVEPNDIQLYSGVRELACFWVHDRFIVNLLGPIFSEKGTRIERFNFTGPDGKEVQP